jgi:hypothetical protein
LCKFYKREETLKLTKAFVKSSGEFCRLVTSSNIADINDFNQRSEIVRDAIREIVSLVKGKKIQQDILANSKAAENAIKMLVTMSTVPSTSPSTARRIILPSIDGKTEIDDTDLTI